MQKICFIIFLLLINYLVISCDRTNENLAVFNDNFTQNCPSNKITNEFIVKWKNGQITKVSGMAQHYFVNNFIEKNIDKIHMAEPNYKLTLNPQPMTKNLTCNLDNWHHDDINTSAFWSAGNYGEGITVAVTDSGLDLDNPDLADRISYNTGEMGLDENGTNKSSNGKDDDGNGYVDDHIGIDLIENDSSPNDNFGHGTAVTSIIAHPHLNHPLLTVKGVAPKVKIVPIKFIDENNGSVETAVKAIDYAVQRKVDIINASWGGSNCSNILVDYLKSIEQQNILLVVASGNEGLDLDGPKNNPPTYPASANLKNQITVGSISPFSKKRSSFSNYGHNSVELFAPGKEISTLTVLQEPACLDGTSFAAPIVSGSLALLMNAHPDKNALQIKKLLLDSTILDKDYKNLTQGKLNLNPTQIR